MRPPDPTNPRDPSTATDEGLPAISREERSILVACAIAHELGDELAAEICAALGGAPSVLETLAARSLLELTERPRGGRTWRLSARSRARTHAAEDEDVREAAMTAFAIACGSLARRSLEHPHGPWGADAIAAVLREESNLEELVQIVARAADPSVVMLECGLLVAAALVVAAEERRPSAVAIAIVDMLLGPAMAASAIADDAVAMFEACAASVLDRAGHFERAALLHSSAIACARRSGTSRVEVFVLVVRAREACVRGRRDELDAILCDLYAITMRSREPWLAAEAEKLAAEAHATSAELGVGRARLARAQIHASRTGDGALVARLKVTRAWLLLEDGQLRSALELACDARDECSRVELPKSSALACLVAGAAALELGRDSEASALVSRAIEHGQRLQDAQLLAYGGALVAMTLVARGEYARAATIALDETFFAERTPAAIRTSAVHALRAAVLALGGFVERARRIIDDARAAPMQDDDAALIELSSIVIDAADGVGEAQCLLAKWRETVAASSSVVIRLAAWFAGHASNAFLPPAGALALCEPERTVRLPDGEIVDFSSKPLMWKLSSVLARHHATARGAPIARDRLVAELWPGEDIDPKAAQNRLSVALHKLRGTALGPLVRTTRAGAMLDPSTQLVAARRLTDRPRAVGRDPR